MTIIDTDHNGTIDFHELAKGLQKLDLRVEVSAPRLPMDLGWISRWISRWISDGSRMDLPMDLPMDHPMDHTMACPLIEFRCTSICSW